MNLNVQDIYLGWAQLTHGPDCARPSWTVDVREDEHFRASYGGAPTRHSCPDEDCDHGRSYARTSVRAVCFSCHRAHLISGESISKRTTTKATGFGEAPCNVAGLYLWPGESWFDDAPHEFLVTQHKPKRPQASDVIGSIHEGRGPRGGKQFSAAASPATDGMYGHGKLRWSRAEKGFTSLSSAAKWIAAQAPGSDEAK
ncbi:hypothetical protein [Streptomyces sp. NPDC056670]|uniref:hypothetical protein n=1 Tax=Streptomyces sp. NPDC056670 TaxID=3345904 RepID=UPI00368B5A2A